MQGIFGVFVINHATVFDTIVGFCLLSVFRMYHIHVRSWSNTNANSAQDMRYVITEIIEANSEKVTSRSPQN